MLYGGYSQSIKYEAFNPAAIIDQNINTGNESTSALSLSSIYSFDKSLKGLSVKIGFQFQDQNLLTGQYFSKNSMYGSNGGKGLGNRATQSQTRQQFLTTVAYEKKVKDIGFQINSGYQYQDNFQSSLNLEGGDFLTDAFTFNNLVAARDFQNGLGKVASSADSYKLISFLNAASVVYKDKYFLNATANSTGSTRLGANNKWAFLPSISGGVEWKNLPLFNSLKLRAAWGKVGNQPQQSNLSGSLITQSGGNYFYNGNYLPSYYTVREANPDLKWEEKTEIDIGTDFTVLNNRIKVSFDWFTNSVTNFYTLYTAYNFDNSPRYSHYANFGEVQNKGLELNAEMAAINNTKFKWVFNINLSTINTEVVSLKGGSGYADEKGRYFPSYVLSGPGSSASGVTLVQEGSPVGQIFGPVFDGVNADGTPKYKDLDGDGRSIADSFGDKKVIGNGLPSMFLGWGNRLSYQRFELSFFFRGAFGHQKINSYRFFQETTNAAGYGNLVKSAHAIPSLRYDYFSDRYAEDADFIKLDNISVKYHVPSTFNITITATVQNLFTLTSYSGLDPEAAYPNPALKGGARVYIPYSNQFTAGIEARGNYLPSKVFSIAASFKF